MISQALIYTTIAYIGSCIAGIMLIPQVYLTIKTKKTDDISLEFLILNMLAVLAMIPYSIYFKLHPILIANLSIGFCTSILLYYKFLNVKHKNNIREKTDKQSNN